MSDSNDSALPQRFARCRQNMIRHNIVLYRSGSMNKKRIEFSDEKCLR